MPQSDADWWTLAAKIPRGHKIVWPQATLQQAHALAAMGFVDMRDGHWLHVANLHEDISLTPTHAPQLPGIDAIAVVTVARPGDQAPYLYRTLLSLFAEFPSKTVVNVVVGSSDDDYVAPGKLRVALGDHRAARVCVHRLPPDAAYFLEAKKSLSYQATYNHARALRGYHGSKNLLFLEDDVIWAAKSAQVLAGWLEAPHAEALSLYNWFCEQFPGASHDPCGNVGLVTCRAVDLAWRFSRTQSMVYQCKIVRDLGYFMGARLGVDNADHLVDAFMRQRQASFGYAQPSMTQHIGMQTTGLGYYHRSSCFFASYPQPQSAESTNNLRQI